MGDYLIKKELVEYFGNDILKNSLLWYEDGEENLRYFLDKIQPKEILEIGTMYGLSTVVLAEYGNVDTFDIDDHKHKYEVWGYLDIKIKINFYNTLYIKSNKNYDFVLIDGEHWKGQLEKDYNNCIDIPNILIHDYNDAHTEIKSFVDKLDRRKEFKTNFCLIN